ncbi:5'-nucleotidase [Amycolatopsis arida]|uniref:5'-nucleotidase n=1 Tax=Amycolatopsis arida TaxID=587909 RepID=A0A1I5XIT1_9PSEU|nr:5'/3'-nucleotidase SurE [Amycolatopsis arida]TDX97438.1 5'-nucleotidase [Amycolatopsis arida]SFQ31567.1 5'-nucleotidase [Amycolatopsis arida]
MTTVDETGRAKGAAMALRALITNDDGIASDGLAVLAHAAVAAGFDTVVAAPHEESSGTSAGLTVLAEEGTPVISKVDRPGLPDVDCYSVAAHPAFITLAATEGAFGPPPDVVLSGVNRGANVGRAVVHSGTVGAALTAVVNERRGLAVSLQVEQGGPPRWEAAAAVLRVALPMLERVPAGVVLNVNVPNLPPERLGPLTRAGLSSRGVVQTQLEHRDHTSDVVTAVVGGEDGARPGTDVYLLERGVPTMTALRPVSEADDDPLPEEIPLSARG